MLLFPPHPSASQAAPWTRRLSASPVDYVTPKLAGAASVSNDGFENDSLGKGRSLEPSNCLGPCQQVVRLSSRPRRPVTGPQRPFAARRLRRLLSNVLTEAGKKKGGSRRSRAGQNGAGGDAGVHPEPLPRPPGPQVHCELGAGCRGPGRAGHSGLTRCPRSTLTHSIVRRRFLAHVGRDHLEPDEKQALKRLVEEELLKTQVGAGPAPRGRGLRRGGARDPRAHVPPSPMPPQVDEAGGGEEKPGLAQKVKRSPGPCSDPERKRPRFNAKSG